MSILECSGLTKTYGAAGRTIRALDHVDLGLEPGRIVGLLGPNGSGKTTMLKIAAGLLQPTEGELRIDGHLPGPETKAETAYLPDRDFLPPYMTTIQLLNFYEDFFADFDRPRAQEMLAGLNIPPKQVFRKMSKGSREKVQLVMTMSRRAKVYLLDEPIAGVDPAAREYIIRTIIGNFSEDAMVLISTHLIADIETVLDDIVFLQNGRIVLHRTPDDIRESEGTSVDGLFRQVFGY